MRTTVLKQRARALLVIARRQRYKCTCTREPPPPRRRLPLLLAQLCRFWPSCYRARMNNCRWYWIRGCATMRAPTSAARPHTFTPPIDGVFRRFLECSILCRKFSPYKALSVRVAASVASHCAGTCAYSLAYEWIVHNEGELVPVSRMRIIVGLRFQ